MPPTDTVRYGGENASRARVFSRTAPPAPLRVKNLPKSGGFFTCSRRLYPCERRIGFRFQPPHTLTVEVMPTPHLSPQVSIDLIKLASAQAGVVTREQLRRHGTSDRVTQRKVRLGLWSNRLGCVQIVQARPSADWADASALCLRFGKRAIITSRLAIRLAGYDVARIENEPLTILIPCRSGRRRIIPPRGGRAIFAIQRWKQEESPPGKVTHRSGVSFRSPVDALLDALATEPRRSASELLDWALQMRLVSGKDLGNAVDLRSRRQRVGIPVLRHFATRCGSNARSEAERRLHRLLRRERIAGWTANLAVRSRSGKRAELDVAWPDERVCIEVDGRAFHTDAVAFERDRSRRNWISLEGWLMLQFTWTQITTEPEEAVRVIRRALKSREVRVSR